MPAAPVAVTATFNQTGEYYVKTGGSDSKDGFTEANAFKSLGKAVAAATGDVSRKKIVVLSDLSESSESGAPNRDAASVFTIKDSGSTQIIISSTSGQNFKLKGDSSKRAVYVTGTSNIKFENIQINGAALGASSKTTQGGGLYIATQASTVILGTGAKISGNTIANANSALEQGGGVFIAAGTLTLDGGEISENSAQDGGGGVIIAANNNAVFNFTSGSIHNNKSLLGGGVLVNGDGTNAGKFYFNGGNIYANEARGYGTADAGYGSGVAVIKNGLFSLNGGGKVADTNDVFLPVGSVITIGSSFGVGSAVAAFITPNPYTNGTLILSGSNIASAKDSFSVKDSPAGEMYSISNDGKLVAPPISTERYYVSANGADTNNGTAEGTPFKTLKKAVTMATASSTIKTIVVLGTLNENSEALGNNDSVFYISNTGGTDKTITITGKDANNMARLTAVKNDGSYSGKRVIQIQGSDQTNPNATLNITSSVKFQYIEIDGGYGGYAGNGRSWGGGVSLLGQVRAYFGEGVLVHNNSGAEGGGIHHGNGASSFLTGSSARIWNNSSNDTGGGVDLDNNSRFYMMAGTIEENRARGSKHSGGGVECYTNSGFSMSGGKIYNNFGKWANGNIGMDNVYLETASDWRVLEGYINLDKNSVHWHDGKVGW
jgi:hypothetical protein